jgi:hypothetical protein
VATQRSPLSISWTGYAVAAACLILVTLPRFNQQDWGPIEALAGQANALRYPPASSSPTLIVGDAKEYLRYALYFEGHADVEVEAPFAYRPLVPLLGALLPVDPFTGINLVNVMALLLGLGALFSTLSLRGGTPFEQTMAGLLYAVSFPSFYYGSIGYVDATLVGVLGLGLLLLLRDHGGLFLLVLALGSLVKETVVLLVPVAACYDVLRGRPWTTTLARAGTGLALVVGTTTCVRLLAPAPPTTGWAPDVTSLTYNLTRPRTALGFLLSFGLPGVLAAPVLLRWLRRGPRHWRAHPEDGALVAGSLLGIALFAYAFVSAAAEGRFVWVLYPFALPLSLPVLRRIRRRWGLPAG